MALKVEISIVAPELDCPLEGLRIEEIDADPRKLNPNPQEVNSYLCTNGWRRCPFFDGFASGEIPMVKCLWGEEL
jgi:hypothetical protein